MTRMNRITTRRTPWLAAAAAALALLAPAAASAAPTASFSVSASPITLSPVTFTSTSTIPGGETVQAISWDFNGDGTTDSSGATASRTYDYPGGYAVTLTVATTGGTDRVTQVVDVANRAPIADFLTFANGPLATTKLASAAAPGARKAAAGDRVTFVSTSLDPDGSIATHRWDLDDDGAFDDGTGTSASRVFDKAGTYNVGLYVRDRQLAATIVRKRITVENVEAKLISPFPRVRIAGRALLGGTRLSLLFVRAPKGATVSVSCVAKPRCPFKTVRRKVKTGSVRIRQVERFLRTGTLVRVRVTQKDRIGSYTSFQMRRGRSPLRRERCLYPGSSKPKLCPDQ